MNRKYTREWYLDRIAAIRRILPDCGITTDMFSGFHSETEEDFEETLSLMREVGFDSSFLFKYSERPGTYASKHLPDDVPEEVKIARLQRMIDLQNELSLESNRRDIGPRVRSAGRGFLEAFARTALRPHPRKTRWWSSTRATTVSASWYGYGVTDASSATLLGEALELNTRVVLWEKVVKDKLWTPSFCVVVAGNFPALFCLLPAVAGIAHVF